MVVRPIGKNGDMVPVSYGDQLLTGNDAIAQVVRQRLRLYVGEWWEDETLGFRIPEFLAENPTVENMGMLGSYIASYIVKTEGVTGVTNVSVSCLNRKLTFRCTVKTGEVSSEMEVDLDGVLSSEY